MKRTEDYKRELISILFAQKHVIFWATFLIFAGAALVAFYWPPTYGASGSILVSGKKLTVASTEALESSENRIFEITKEDLSSEVEILKSPLVIEEAIKYLASKYPSLAQTTADGNVSSAGIYAVLNNLKTTVKPSSNVVGITYLSRDAREAVDVLSVLMEQYIIHRMRILDKQDLKVSSKFLGDRAATYREALEAKEDELASLVDQTMASDPAREVAENIILKKRLEQVLNTLRNEYIDKRVTLEHFRKALEGSDLQYFSFIDNKLINELSIKVAELSAERGRVLRTYLEGSSVVVTIDEQIAATFETLQKEVSAYMKSTEKDLQIAGEKIASIEEEIARYDERNVDLQKQVIAENRIKREAELLQFSYEVLSKRRDEVEINNTFEDDDASRFVSILNKAFPSQGPVFPQRRTIIPLGLLAGLILGCSLGLLREYFDHSFKKPSDVENYANLPVLFSLSARQNPSLGLGIGLLYLLLFAAVLIFILWQSYAVPVPVI